MFHSSLPEPELIKSLLEPLLEDFQYWFGRSQSLLEAESIEFLGDEKQADLLARVKQAQSEVRVAQMLFSATGEQAGVEVAVLVPWHRLVTECWQVAVRFRSENAIDLAE